MKITIKGSPKELAELAKVLVSTENKEKNADLPPLLTELAKNDKINEFAKAMRPALEKINESTKRRKENAPQMDATEQKKNQEVFKKQMELLSKASEFCTGDVHLTQCLPTLTQAMIELNPFCMRD